MNETTAQDQAVKEATSKWEKQFDKGYIDNKEDALASISNVIVKPMLAHSFSDHGKKVKYPALVQQKLDGIRCVAVISKSGVKLYSRKSKLITSMVHIKERLKSMDFSGWCWDDQPEVILDGELYNHKYRHDFGKIVSMVRKKKPTPGCEIIEYHLYDVYNEVWNQSQRWQFLQGLERCEGIELVLTGEIQEESQLDNYYCEALECGYEGVIVRNMDALYEQKRSYNLQKYKKFKDDEFPIIGIEEGRGKLAGHASAFICVAENGETFKAKLKGSLSFLKKCFEDHSLWKGKQLTVQYQGLTDKDMVPRFPVGKAIRDYE